MTSTRQRIQFGDEQTITVAELRVGDFITILPTQHGVRGVTANALVERVDDLSGSDGDALTESPESSWRQRGSRRGARVAARRIVTRLGTLNVPAAFSVSVRRPI